MKSAIVFIVFTASWCAPCRQFKADFAEVQAFDVDQNRTLAESYGVVRYPTVIAIEDGHEIARKEGYDGKAKMKKWMSRWGR